MAYTVDFNNVSTVGLESSPVADALAGLRANEARYFKNKYDHVFTVEPASEAKDDRRLGAPDPQGGARHRHRVAARSRRRPSRSRTSDGLRVLRERPVDQRDVRVDDGEKRAVGFKLSDGHGGPRRSSPSFKFARQKSKLAGTIRGSYFVIKGEY